MNCPIKYRSPFGENYCLAWLIYHGAFTIIGAAMLTITLGWSCAPIGMIPGVVAGIGNFLIDRSFDRRRS
jgi:hypothetical protein